MMRPMSTEELKLLAVFPDQSSKWISKQDLLAARAGGAVVTVVRGEGDGWSWDRGLFKG